MSDAPAPSARNKRLAVWLTLLVAGMVGLAFAAVPLYQLFCQVTGFDGTVRRAEAAPGEVLDRKMLVRFDSNVRDLPWTFRAEQVRQELKIGETGLAYFRVTNNSDKPTTGMASYNVVPEQAGPYFLKLECFCFEAQTLQPGESMEFPVAYFVDPELVRDSNSRGVREITLSYTFFPTEKPQSQAAVREQGLGGRG